MRKLSLFIILLYFFTPTISAKTIPSKRVLSNNEIAAYLNAETRKQLKVGGEITDARLAQYFREKFSERFFYDYKTFNSRYEDYKQLYKKEASHKENALDHISKFPDSVQWILPFNYKNGKPVNAYAIRHLARQHKMVDIAFYYFQDNKNPKYIQYFEKQLQSLNIALKANKYETIENGNGVYEAFRSGYRVYNWLWIHNMLLNEPAYSDADQLQTIATLLQHGQHLYESNEAFSPGNHQTKGVASLAVLSILFRDFEGTDKWNQRAMLRLSEHLDKEVNPDGFQFERSVHYHMSDIDNYFFVYQLAQLNKIAIDKNWEQKLRSLFTTLAKIAYPDKSAPVLQDDTEIPWGEKNNISEVMTLGYLLFNDPEFGYFATNKVNSKTYWLLSDAQLKKLSNIEKKTPNYGSLAFDDTHYYIMREGWRTNDKMMIISAGLDDKKPDHQHGDMLGIQAIANSKIILPNYQVRYNLKDFELFKNSMVKNVALVDNELQGKEWTSNQGGSGFGKFKQLPHPSVIAWESNDKFDFFAGSHDGFENVGVKYSRQVIYIKDAFWIVKDNFSSPTKHAYKQVWQGHYTSELGSKLIRTTFDDATGCDILQLNATDTSIVDGTRGKHWTVISKTNQTNFNFLSVIFPYKGYGNRIDEDKKSIVLDGWKVNQSDWKIKGENSTIISKDNEFYFFNVTELSLNNIQIQTPTETDLYINLENNKLVLFLLGDKELTLSLNKENISLKPGESHTLVY